MTTSWHTSEHQTWPIAPARLIVSDGAQITARATDYAVTTVTVMISESGGRVTVANIGFEPLAFEALWQTISDVRVVLARRRGSSRPSRMAWVADDVIFGGE